MSLYRRFARSKKGMSTIFGGLFFVIIILMGFNVMLWGFIQYDAYNHVITSMSQRDQIATSENLVPVNVTCSSTCASGSGTLTVIVNNLGGYSVTIANVYIFNTNTTGSCRLTPCIANPSGTSGNIPAGATKFLIRIPFCVSILSINNGEGGNFVTNVGPLSVYFDFRSFNYTQGTQTTSNPAFCMTPGSSIIYVRIANTGNATVTIESSTMMQMQPY